MSAEEERWHVRIAPGEVKVLTLEQIDDLFRLGMIDEDTLLRQEGSEQWLPLRVVAGLDDEEEAAPVAAPPVVQSAPPPVVRSAPPPPPPPIPPPSERAPFAPSPSFIPPAPVSVRSPSAAPPPPPPPRPSNPVPSFAPPPVAPMPAISVPPPLAAARGSRSEAWLIALAAVLGLVVVLYRNGVVAGLFASAGQAAAYEKLEASLGGPGSGTPRAVEALTVKSAKR